MNIHIQALRSTTTTYVNTIQYTLLGMHPKEG